MAAATMHLTTWIPQQRECVVGSCFLMAVDPALAL
jgi:hypothetical protein